MALSSGSRWQWIATLLLVLLLSPGDPPVLRQHIFIQHPTGAVPNTPEFTTVEPFWLANYTPGHMPSVTDTGFRASHVPAAAAGWFAWPQASSGAGMSFAAAQDFVFEIPDAVLQKLRWGKNGNFAGFTAFSLNPAKKQCGYLFDGSSSLYNYAGEYARVQDGLEWKVAAVDYNATAEMFMAFDNFRLIFGLSNLPITVLTILPYSIINTVCFKRKTFRVQSGAASKLPMEPGGVIDERNMLSLRSVDPLPLSSLRQIKMKKELDFFFKKTRTGRILGVVGKSLLFIGQTLLKQYIGPIRQAGMVAEGVGKLAKSPALQKAGNTIYRVSNQPEKRLKDAIRATTPFCKAGQKYLAVMETLGDLMSRANTLIGLINNVAMVPHSYRKCAEQESLILSRLEAVRKQYGADGDGTGTSGGRRLKQVSSGGAITVQEQLARANSMAAAVKGFNENIAAATRAFNETAMPILDKAFDVWLESKTTINEILDKVEAAFNWFQSWPVPIVDFLMGLSAVFPELPECNNILCSSGELIGKMVDTLIDKAIEALSIGGFKDFGALLDYIFETVVPIPAWMKPSGLLPDLVFPLPTEELEAFLATAEDQVLSLITNIVKELEDLAEKVINLAAGTTILDASPEPYPDVLRRVSITSGTIINIVCPNGWAVYMESFTVQQPPDCTADYTTWLRFPCSGSSCNVEWTRVNWRCSDSSLLSGLPFSLSPRQVTAVYLCVSQAGLETFKLLPELVTRAKDGSDGLPNIGYTQKDLPTVSTLAGFSRQVDIYAGFAVIDWSNDYTPSYVKNSDWSIRRTAPLARRSPPLSSGDSYNRGSLFLPQYDGSFFSSNNLDISCSNAAPFGLPTLLLEATDVDPCYDKPYFDAVENSIPVTGYPTNEAGEFLNSGVDPKNRDPRYGRSLELPQVKALRADMCAWRQVSKRGWTQELVNITLQAMIPSAKIPWSSPPTEQQFRDFWLPRGSCEYFGTNKSSRSHFAYSTWLASVVSNEADCALQVLGPNCTTAVRPFSANELYYEKRYINYVACDTRSQSVGWPLIGPADDPAFQDPVIGFFSCATAQFGGPNAKNLYACQRYDEILAYTKDTFCNYRSPLTSLTLSSYDQAVENQMNTDNTGLSLTRYFFADLSTGAAAVSAAVNSGQPVSKEVQWAAECSLEYIRGSEFSARRKLADAYGAYGDRYAPNTNCGQRLAACNMTQGSCAISSLFSCAGSLGVVQYACIPDSVANPVNGSTTTLVFRESLKMTAKRIACGANQQLAITSAEWGNGRAVKDVLRFVAEDMCNNDGTACILDAKSPRLPPIPGNVLSVKWQCACNPGFESIPVNGVCTPCEVGTYRDNKMASCLPTPPGTYSNTTGTVDPIPCAAGAYQPGYGAEDCSLCPAGTFSAAVGATNIATCQTCVGVNSFSDEGASSCSSCGAGTVVYAVTVNVTVNATDGSGNYTQISCVDCPAGTYRTAAMDSLKCTACSPGTYSPLNGSAVPCQTVPAGSFAAFAGAISPTPCPPGSYQPQSGATSCLPCPDGTTTATAGAVSADECVNVTVIPPDLLEPLLELANTPGQCAALAAALEAAGLANATVFLDEVNNTYCSHSVWLNSPACAYDGGDCCPSTCQPACVQVASKEEDENAVDTFITLSGSCDPTRFQCRDPVALESTTVLAPNCTGYNADAPYTLLQRLTLPVFDGDDFSYLDLVTIPSDANGGVRRECDWALNTESNNWDGGDCCEQSCNASSAAGSCSAFWCLDPKYANATSAAPGDDKRPPTINPPANYATFGGEVPLTVKDLKAFDEVDGFLPTTAVITSSDASLDVTIDQPLPFSTEGYTVTITWTAKDSSNNAASASQIIIVKPSAVQACTGNPEAPANAENYSCVNKAAGSSCSTNCSAGYELSSGSLKSVCQGAGAAGTSKWSNATGECTELGCAAGGPATPANAVTFNCKASAAGANCPTSCKPGYQLAAANGNLISTCVKGNWTEVLGTCLEMGCARPGPEAPDNAKPYACSDTAAGLSCSTTCQPGYSKVGSLSSLCKEGAWVKPTGNCTEDGCAAPGPSTAPVNALPFNCPSAQPRDSCPTTCATGHFAQGDLSSICREGKWGNVTGSCIESGCAASPGPAAVQNAVSYNCTATAAGGTCTTQCKDGYFVIGNLTATCSLGSWRAATGSCLEKGCSGPGPTAPRFATPFTCADTAAGGPVCTTTCAEGYYLQPGDSLSTSCRLGVWTAVNTNCLEKPCTTQPATVAGATAYACTLPAQPNRTCTTSCGVNYVLARGSLTVTCARGEWSAATAACAVLPVTPGCGKTCLCSTKAACLNGTPKDKCGWSDAARKCYVNP